MGQLPVKWGQIFPNKQKRATPNKVHFLNKTLECPGDKQEGVWGKYTRWQLARKCINGINGRLVCLPREQSHVLAEAMVFDGSGHHNKSPANGCLPHTTNWFLKVLLAGESKIKALAGVVSAENPTSWFIVFLPVSPRGRRRWGRSSRSLFLYGHESHSWRLYLGDLITSQRPFLPSASHWGLELSLMNLGAGNVSIQSTVPWE